jgi:hypothetical protein
MTGPVAGSLGRHVCGVGVIPVNNLSRLTADFSSCEMGRYLEAFHRGIDWMSKAADGIVALQPLRLCASPLLVDVLRRLNAGLICCGQIQGQYSKYK